MFQILCNISEEENIPMKNVAPGESCSGKPHRQKCAECKAFKKHIAELKEEKEHGRNIYVPIGGSAAPALMRNF